MLHSLKAWGRRPILTQLNLFFCLPTLHYRQGVSLSRGMRDGHGKLGAIYQTHISMGNAAKGT